MVSGLNAADELLINLVLFRGSGLPVLNYFWFSTPDTHCALVIALSEKKLAPFSMAIGNVEIMHECSHKHFCMGTARMK